MALLPWGIFFFLGFDLPLLDEVMSLLVCGDVSIGVAEELLRGSRSFMEDGVSKGLVTRSMIEVFDHWCLSDIGNVVPYRLKMLQEGPKGFIVLALDGLEVPWLRHLIREHLKVGDKLVVEVDLVVDVVVMEVAMPLERVLPQHNGKVCCHQAFSYSGRSGGSGVDSQPTARVLLSFILVDF